MGCCGKWWNMSAEKKRVAVAMKTKLKISNTCWREVPRQTGIELIMSKTVVQAWEEVHWNLKRLCTQVVLQVYLRCSTLRKPKLEILGDTLRVWLVYVRKWCTMSMTSSVITEKALALHSDSPCIPGHHKSRQAYLLNPSQAPRAPFFNCHFCGSGHSHCSPGILQCSPNLSLCL